MKGLMICVLATAWVLEAIWLRGFKWPLYERPTAVSELPTYTTPDGRVFVLKPHEDWTLKESAGGVDGTR